MQKSKDPRGIFLIYTSFVAFGSILVLSGMLLSPSEPGNSVFLRLSLPRLIIAMGLLFAFIFFLSLFLKAFKDQRWTERAFEQWFGGGRFSKVTFWLAGISFGLGWIGCFLPFYRAGILGNYWSRIQPMMIFILSASVATLAVFLIMRSNFSIRGFKNSGIFRLSFVLFLGSLLVLVFMLYTKYGVYDLEDFWYGAGVPILASQLIMAIVGGVLFLLLKKDRNNSRLDIVIFVLLFAMTAILWAREPLQKSFLFTEPRPPNEILYPFADSAAFDAGSQFALIGQGMFIFNNPFTDRPLYLSLLVYLHSLFGQNYELLMAAQAALFAILPALIYLIGRSLNMRAVGFASAVMTTLRGINSIAGSTMIDMANPKMILSDFPAAIGVALIILLACEWLKKPKQKWHYAAWVGGVIGLTLMIRPNALVILVFIPFYVILSFAPQWRKWLFACILIGLGVAAVTLPWELRNVARGGIMYSSLITKIQDVIRTRYGPANDEGSLSPTEKRLSIVTFQQANTISSLYQPTEVAQEGPCNSILCFAPKHLLHNTITSILILPTSPILDDLRHTVKGVHPYWRANWPGNFTPSSLFFFVLNVFFIVLGISVAWKQQRLPGLAPLAIFVIYNLSNAFARTSGGRYIVPADWIITLYFTSGVLFLFREIATSAQLKQLSFFNPENLEDGGLNLAASPWLKTLVVLTLLFVAGSFVPLSEKLHSPRYADFNATEALQERETQIAEAGFELAQINNFLENPGAEILVGRSLYPRSYKLGQGEVAFYFYPYTIMEFPRTGFFLIGPKGQDGILLPGGVPKYLPHAVDALVIGCREINYIDALMVIILDDVGAVYARSPMSELTCPLRQPVCENNSVCK